MLCLGKERHYFSVLIKVRFRKRAPVKDLVGDLLGWRLVTLRPFISISSIFKQLIIKQSFQTLSNIDKIVNFVQNIVFPFCFSAVSLRYVFLTPTYWESFVVPFTKPGKRFLGNVLFSLYFIMASELSRIQVRQNEVKVTIFFILLRLAFIRQRFLRWEFLSQTK